MYGLEESSENEAYLFYWLSVIFVFLFIPSNGNNNPLLSDIICFLIYMIPTLFFIITFVNIKTTSLDFNLKNLKQCKFNILLMILGIVLATYIFIINVWNIFFSIPIVLTSIELVLVRYMEICSSKDFITSKWYTKNNLKFQNCHIILKDRIDPEELELYKKFKWNGIFFEFIQSLAISFASSVLFLIPLDYFHLNDFKFIGIISIYFFLKGGFIQHIIDCKFNLFTKMTGICVEITPLGAKMSINYRHKIVDFKNKNITSVILPRKTYKIGTRLTVVYGALSGSIIRFY